MLEYLCGLFLADGYIHHLGRSKLSSSKGYFETKDYPLACKLRDNYGNEIVELKKRVRTGVVCTMYRVDITNQWTNKIRECYTSYKDFREWFFQLSDSGKHSFMKGLFDGDGSICIRSVSDSYRVIFYSSQVETDEIIEGYLNLFNLKFSISDDTRGVRVRSYTVGNRKDIAFLFFNWYGEVFLPRKYELFVKSVVSTEWFSYDGILFCERKSLAHYMNKPYSSLCIILKSDNLHLFSINRVHIEEMVSLSGDRDELNPGELSDEGCVRLFINNRMLTAKPVGNVRAKLIRESVQTIES